MAERLLNRLKNGSVVRSSALLCLAALPASPKRRHPHPAVFLLRAVEVSARAQPFRYRGLS